MFPEYFCLKLPNLGALLPGIAGETGLPARLGDERFTIPLPFGGHMRKELARRAIVTRVAPSAATPR